MTAYNIDSNNNNNNNNNNNGTFSCNGTCIRHNSMPLKNTLEQEWKTNNLNPHIVLSKV